MSAMPDPKVVLPVLKGVARYADQDQFLEFCADYLPPEFYRRMRGSLVDLWLVFHGSPEESDEPLQ